MTQQLRFAALARVSDIGQAGDRKTSLQSQMKQIEAAVDSLKGKIVKHYVGQEHATPDFERKLLDLLIQDSGKGVYDAVIVSDLSRWSRDNARSKQDIETLKGNNIRFFVGTMEYNLRDPGHRFLLGVTTETSQFFAETQNLKMVMGKIEGAKKGAPTNGKGPYGRVYDKKTGKWSIDELKQAKIARAVKSYLNNQASSETIARVAGMDRASLYTILKTKLGDKWVIAFNSDKWNIHEEVTLTIPRLVDQETEEAVITKMESQRTWDHAKPKNFYLLRGYVFCEHCGRSLESITIREGWSYYRHKNKECPFRSIRTYLIDGPVMKDLFELFGDPVKREQAMRNAATDLKESRRLEKDIDHLDKQLNELARGKNRIIHLVTKGLFTDEEIAEKMTKIRDRESSIKNSITIARTELDQSVTKEQIRQAVRSFKFEELAAQIEHSRLGGSKHLEGLTDQQKRAILQHIFRDKFTENGKQKRAGVYIRKGQKGWLYSVRGSFPPVKGMLKDDLKRSLISQKRRNTQ